MIDFKALVDNSNFGFEEKVKERITGYADKILEKNDLPSFSELNNIRQNAYEKVMNNASFDGSLNDYFNPDITGNINNSLALGLVSKIANVDKNSPGTVANQPGAKTTQNVATEFLSYPIPGSDGDEVAPYMKISGFKYQYDSNDVLGNKRASMGSEGKQPNPAVNRTALIRLPLPGNLASGLSQQFEDYSSVFAKLVKAYNGSGGLDAAGFKTQVEEFADGLNPGILKDLGAIAGAAGIFGAVTDGASGAVTASLDESLKYIRVAAGFTVNPMQQTSYIGANMRTHSFEFNMIPKNQREAIECKKIIETLQFYSIGAKMKEFGGIFIEAPSVWNIEFLAPIITGSNTIKYQLINGMLSIPDSFLESVNVTYSPSRAGFTVTRDNDPFAYVLNLTFRECQNLVRDDLWYIRQGEKLMGDTQKQTFNKTFEEKPKPIPTTTADTTPSTDNNDPSAAPGRVIGTTYTPATKEEIAKKEEALKDAAAAARPGYTGTPPMTDAQMQAASAARKKGETPQTNKLEALSKQVTNEQLKEAGQLANPKLNGKK